MYGNVVVRALLHPLIVHGGKNNVIENNIFIGGDQAVAYYDGIDGMMPRMANFFGGNRFCHNIICNSAEAAYTALKRPRTAWPNRTTISYSMWATDRPTWTPVAGKAMRCTPGSPTRCSSILPMTTTASGPSLPRSRWAFRPSTSPRSARRTRGENLDIVIRTPDHKRPPGWANFTAPRSVPVRAAQSAPPTAISLFKGVRFRERR